jgi:hypothetical protein
LQAVPNPLDGLPLSNVEGLQPSRRRQKK